MNEPIHVLAAANASYVLPLCVMLTSILVNLDPKRKLIIHILTNDIPEKDREDIQRSLFNNRNDPEGLEIFWYAVDLSPVKDFPLNRHSLDALSRLFAADVLPSSCERAIYLDCDTLAVTDLAPLYDSARAATVLHAVHDPALPLVSHRSGVFNYAEMGIPPDSKYFNSGMLVINFKRWREKDVTQRVVAYMVKHGGKIACLDQGALNAILYNDWTPLDLTWNVTWAVLVPEIWEAAGYSKSEWRRNLKHPKIVHYAGQKKPWEEKKSSPRFCYFYRYLEQTSYKSQLKRGARLESLIGPTNYFYLWKAGRAFQGKG